MKTEAQIKKKINRLREEAALLEQRLDELERSPTPRTIDRIHSIEYKLQRLYNAQTILNWVLLGTEEEVES